MGSRWLDIDQVVFFFLKRTMQMFNHLDRTSSVTEGFIIRQKNTKNPGLNNVFDIETAAKDTFVTG